MPSDAPVIITTLSVNAGMSVTRMARKDQPITIGFSGIPIALVARTA
jgi:hypothetical protein